MTELNCAKFIHRHQIFSKDRIMLKITQKDSNYLRIAAISDRPGNGPLVAVVGLAPWRPQDRIELICTELMRPTESILPVFVVQHDGLVACSHVFIDFMYISLKKTFHFRISLYFEFYLL